MKSSTKHTASPKKKIKANSPIEEELLIQEEPVAVVPQEDDVVVVEVPEEVVDEIVETEECACKYCNAIDLISAAIEALAEVAKDDPIAKDSIANLGVVMLDLKGNC